jgi:hypothetical protein
MSHKKSLRCSSLSTKNTKALLDNVLATIITDVDAQILTSHDSGRNSVRCELPTTFSIGTMQDKDAQFYIYSELINQFVLSEDEGGKGFDPDKVSLEKTDRVVVLVVKWDNGMDQSEKEWRRELLKSYTVIK